MQRTHAVGTALLDEYDAVATPGPLAHVQYLVRPVRRGPAAPTDAADQRLRA